MIQQKLKKKKKDVKYLVILRIDPISRYGRTVYGKEGWSMNELNNLDISIFAIFIVQVLVNLLLVFAAVKKIPSHAIPWLCANSVVIGILLVSILVVN